MRISAFDKKIAAFGSYKAAMANRTELKLARTDSFTNLSALPVQKPEAFDSAVLSKNGNPVLIPYSYGAVVHFNVSTGAYTETALPVTTSARFSGGCLSDDGMVIMTPLLHPNVGRYNPDTKVYTNGAATGGKAFRGSVNVRSDLIVFTPGNHANVGLYNPISDTFTLGAATPDNASFGGGGSCLLPDGRVFMVCVSTAKPLIYDPVSNTTEYVTTPVTFGINSFCDAICLPNGWVVLCPYASKEAYIWDSYTKKWLSQTIVVAATSRPRFRGACLMQNGDICLIPYGNLKFGRLRFDKLTYEESASVESTAHTYIDGVSLPDGRVFVVPYNPLGSLLYPTPAIYNGCVQGIGLGSVALSRFMNHK